MRRLVLLRIAAVAALFLIVGFVSARPAQAEAEYCPAEAQAPQLFAAPNNDTIAFRLMAYSERRVHGDVEVQTDTGFYKAPFKEVALSEDDAKMTVDNLIAFDRERYVSEPVYVRFPAPIGQVVRLWVLDAQSKGDKVFAWDGDGMFDCPTPATPPVSADIAHVAVRTNPAPPAATPPTSHTPVSTAVAIKAPSTDCPVPFAPVSTAHVVAPEYPPGLYLTVPAHVTIEVTVAPNNDVLDADVLQPSGISAIDDAALESARASTYAAGAAFCTTAPGRYIFHTEFQPQ